MASGRARRRLAIKRRGLTGAQQRGLPLRYELRRISRQEFDTRYESAWPRPEYPAAVVAWERGREALWQHVLGCWALIAARGQHCRTTNGQRATALERRGQLRCRRTLQRYSRKLEAIGLATVTHVRKPQGQKDCLALEWHLSRRLACHPPSGNRKPLAPPGGFPACRSTANSSAPPPSAAETGPPDKPAERPGTEQEGLQAQISFQQLKLDMGFGDRAVAQAELGHLRRQLRHLQSSSGKSAPGNGDGHDRDRIASTTSEGFRCSM